jgi:hypothetical protein
MTGKTMSIASISPIASSAPIARAAPLARRSGDAAVAKAPSTALVALVPAAPAGQKTVHLNRPDPSFVTHLIATAALAPQTRVLRRASTDDVEAAYRSAANQNQAAGISSGLLTRLIA